MAKRGRPFTYQSEDERPVTVSLRIPRDLHERMSRYASIHRQSVTELLLDGLTWRLEQDDPRQQSPSDIEHYDNTVIQQKSSARRSGRPATMREPILNLLREHPEGLSAEQIRGLLNAQKPIGDTLQGMRRSQLVRTEGTGREIRYFLAG
jgi:hypothetical protein